MSSDQVELENLFESSNLLAQDFSSYKSSDTNSYLNDINQGSYSNGLITWITDGVSSKQTILADSYLALPLTVTHADFTVNSKLAVKNALTDLIYGVRVTTSNGNALVDQMDGSLPIINGLRLVTERDIDFVEGEGEDIMFCGPDRLLPKSVNPGRTLSALTPAAIGALPNVNIGPASNDTLYNPSLASRVSLFNVATTQAAGTPTVMSFIANIPLKYIHEFFRQMDWPISNFGLQIQIQLSGVGAGTPFYPFVTPQTSAHYTPTETQNDIVYATYAANVGTIVTPAAVPSSYYTGMPCKLFQGVISTSVAPAGTVYGTEYYYIHLTATTFSLASTYALATAAVPTVVAITGAGTSTHVLVPSAKAPIIPAISSATKPTIAVATVTDRGVSLSACRIYFKSVTFRDGDAKRLTAKLAAGFNKTLVFKMTDYPGVQDSLNSSLATRNTILTHSTIRPTAVWVLPVPTGTLAATNNTFPSTIGSNGIHHMLYNSNLQINGTTFYPNQLATQLDFFKILQKRMPNKGGLISLNDYLTGLNPYYFDVSNDATVESGHTCQISLQTSVGEGQVASNTAAKSAFSTTINNNYDLIVVVERLHTIVLEISASAIKVNSYSGIPKAVAI